MEDPRARALQELPTPLAVALRLRDAGETDAVVAEALGIDPKGVPELLKIAEQKLAKAQQRARSGPSGSGPGAPGGTTLLVAVLAVAVLAALPLAGPAEGALRIAVPKPDAMVPAKRLPVRVVTAPMPASDRASRCATATSATASADTASAGSAGSAAARA